MLATLKPKKCDRRALLGLESAGSSYSTRGISPGSDTSWFDTLSKNILHLVGGGAWPSAICGEICLDRIMRNILIAA